MLYLILVLSPLAGFLIVGLFGRLLGDRASQLIACGFMAISALCGIIGLKDLGSEPHLVPLFTWAVVDSFVAEWAIRVDTLSVVMMFVVSTVSFLIHVYSIGYMAHDPGIPRFFAYLSLFTFAMLALVTSDNLIQLYFGWEGVGVASYLLIGYWYTRPSACAAAIKAFIVNRVGDFGLALGLAATWFVFDSIRFDEIFRAAPEFAQTQLVVFGSSFDTLTLIAVLLFIGAVGKSAQLPLHTWLPDAMEGPTPVSALIHAATMVTAGVFLVARFSPLFEHAPDALALVTFIGATTALFAASVGLTQNDIKRVIAYSTCSQLGYMFAAAGVGAYAAGIFHLYTHAFFKALLFLGAGSVIHALHDEQDMRRMGGIWRKLPLTYAVMWIGSLALMGFPGTAGYFSKDAIIEATWASHNAFAGYAFLLLLLAAVLTAFYSGRLMFMTFHGEPRDPELAAHAHESPPVMTVPLLLLALGALLAGWFGSAMLDPEGAFWAGAIFTLSENRVLEEIHAVPLLVKAAPFLAMLLGLGLSWLCYVRMPDLPARTAAALRPVYVFLFNKWCFDELYDALFVRPALRIARIFWQGVDLGVIDRFGPDGVALATIAAARRAVRLQTGYLYHYAFAMLIGIVVLLSWYLFMVRG